MIASETVTFEVPTYGSFRLDGDGLAYLGGDKLDDKEGAKLGVDRFTEITPTTHLTPREALPRVAAALVVSMTFLRNVTISKEREIEAPPEGTEF